PDGKKVAYACQPPGLVDDVCVRDMTTGAVTPIIQSKTFFEHPITWSADGEYLLVQFDEFTGSSVKELRSWSAKTGTLSPFAKRAEGGAAFSPDTRFVAFTSAESGRAEASVTTFPDRRQTWPLTTD